MTGTLPLMSRELPLVVTAAWWFHGWLCGSVTSDDVVEELAAHSPVHALGGTAATRTPDAGDGVLDALATLQLSGAVAVGCALPRPGDPAGLRGPASLNREAVDAGGLVVGIGSGKALVPEVTGSATVWHLRAMNPRPPADLGDADRSLRQALLTGADRLAALDVAAWSPDAADGIMNLHHAPRLTPPTVVPERAVRLAERASHVLAICEAALSDGTGGAVSVAEATGRQDALDDLERAARHALQAAASPDAWPPA